MNHKLIFYNHNLYIIFRVILGIIFIVAGLSKIFYNGQLIPSIDFVPIQYSNFLYFSLAIMEIGLGIFLILDSYHTIMIIITILFILSFIVRNTIGLLNSDPSDCGCFGNILIVSHRQSLVIDGIMLLIVISIFRRGK